MSGITLTAALTANLLSLQSTQTLLDRTQLRLATGLKVNSALDNPSAFFAAQSLNSRSSDLFNLLDGMGQAIQTLKTADQGITTITSFLQQAQAVAKQALAASNANGGGAPTGQASFESQFNQILAQITNVAKDASYRGTNLLDSATNNLTVTYNESGSSSQTIQGVDFTAGSTGTGGGSGLTSVTGSISLPPFGTVGIFPQAINVNAGLNPPTTVDTGGTVPVSGPGFTILNQLNAVPGISASLNGSNQLVISSTIPGATVTLADFGGFLPGGLASLGLSPGIYNPPAGGGGLNVSDANFSSAANIQTSLNAITAALTTVRAQASSFGANLSIIQTRQDFTQNLINTLKEGADKLVVADKNAEGATLLSLETTQQLGIRALALASQSNQAILRLFP